MHGAAVDIADRPLVDSVALKEIISPRSRLMVSSGISKCVFLMQ